MKNFKVSFRLSFHSRFSYQKRRRAERVTSFISAQRNIVTCGGNLKTTAVAARKQQTTTHCINIEHETRNQTTTVNKSYKSADRPTVANTNRQRRNSISIACERFHELFSFFTFQIYLTFLFILEQKSDKTNYTH